MRAIFDASVTSVVVSRELHNAPCDQVTENRKNSFWGLVELSFHVILTTTTVDTSTTTTLTLVQAMLNFLLVSLLLRH